MKALRPRVKRIVGLTGTPSGNGLMDLWAEFRILDMGKRLGRYISQYRNLYFQPDKRNGMVVYSYKPLLGAEEAIYHQIADITVSMKATDYIEQPGETYHIREITYDRRHATRMVQNLEDMGFTMVPFGRGFKDMSPPSKELFKLLPEGNIIHGGNPVLKWMSGNVVMRRDPAGNIKPDKEKSVEKIDGIVASIMVLNRCIRNGTGSGSVYDERGVIAF